MSKNFVEIEANVMKGLAGLSAEIPGTINGFATLHKKALEEGALSAATKELMSLAIAIAIRCEGCIACHVKDALKAGATPTQVNETIGVAILMGGGPSIVYGGEAQLALSQFLAASEPVAD
ncbi:carboxymuconolactone decarboxylase family protein [Microbacterium sp. C7(2022)]|uniref:carboxymuconolactone decarboxylase family protein n=1 Tax=Microbacterium sp. C7(2022) TaxID=2992759 RepID=UPI00237A4012|nr:carboxymuconolactone decarboxylase family protein [Microbacterium sp. C7(2022)]MDE0546336.1 carboxymuconolactone decarboxylase family protein [Microbacterium sp. C7(2022)]